MICFSPIVNVITFGHGTVLGWVSPFLPYLQSGGTHLTSGPVSTEQASWIGSTVCIGGVIGATTFGFLTERLGRKRGLQLIAVPQLVSIDAVRSYQQRILDE